MSEIDLKLNTKYRNIIIVYELHTKPLNGEERCIKYTTRIYNGVSYKQHIKCRGFFTKKLYDYALAWGESEAYQRSLIR